VILGISSRVRRGRLRASEIRHAVCLVTSTRDGHTSRAKTSECNPEVARKTRAVAKSDLMETVSGTLEQVVLQCLVLGGIGGLCENVRKSENEESRIE
jgi:hypothetical protein